MCKFMCKLLNTAFAVVVNVTITLSYITLTLFASGHAAAHLNDKAPFIFKRWAEKYGKLYKVRMADNFAVVLTDPEVIQSIARKIQKVSSSAAASTILRIIHVNHTQPSPNQVMNTEYCACTAE